MSIWKRGDHEWVRSHSGPQTEYNGACTSIRVWYRDGKEVEFGVAEPSWISRSLDAGTYQVLSDGYKNILDKNGILTA